MTLDWIDLSNPVAIWWIFLCIVSVINIALWVRTRSYVAHGTGDVSPEARQTMGWLLKLCALYVFICAFRAILPRADVQKICLFDTWFCTIFVGRSVATVAELSFVAQWAIVLNFLGRKLGSKGVERAAYLIVPMIAVAECFSWYAVISTNYLGNACEESIWGVTYSLIAISLVFLQAKARGILRTGMLITVGGLILYVMFMARVDVPMYLGRRHEDIAAGKVFFGFSAGIHELLTKWVVTHRLEDWKDEFAWMGLYFSVAVWASIGLVYMPALQERLAKRRPR